MLGVIKKHQARPTYVIAYENFMEFFWDKVAKGLDDSTTTKYKFFHCYFFFFFVSLFGFPSFFFFKADWSFFSLGKSFRDFFFFIYWFLRKRISHFLHKVLSFYSYLKCSIVAFKAYESYINFNIYLPYSYIITFVYPSTYLMIVHALFPKFSIIRIRNYRKHTSEWECVCVNLS